MYSRELRPIQLANLSRYRTELYEGFAIWILMFHLQEWDIISFQKGISFPAKLFSHFLTLGSMGVDAFFCSKWHVALVLDGKGSEYL